MIISNNYSLLECLLSHPSMPLRSVLGQLYHYWRQDFSRSTITHACHFLLIRISIYSSRDLIKQHFAGPGLPITDPTALRGSRVICSLIDQGAYLTFQGRHYRARPALGASRVPNNHFQSTLGGFQSSARNRRKPQRRDGDKSLRRETAKMYLCQD